MAALNKPSPVLPEDLILNLSHKSTTDGEVDDRDKIMKDVDANGNDVRPCHGIW